MEFKIIAGRYERAYSTMRDLGIDAWISLGRETNILGEPALEMLLPFEVMGRTAVVLSREGESVCLVSPMEAEELEESGLFTRVFLCRTPEEFVTSLRDQLYGLKNSSRIAVNMSDSDPSSDGLTTTNFLLLKRLLQEVDCEAQLVSAAPLMKKVRANKSDEEVDAITHTVQTAMDIFEEIKQIIHQGQSGRELQSGIQAIIDARGYGYSWHKAGNPYISIGTRSSYLCRRPPQEVYIEPGDIINVDLGLRINGYASDNQRTFYALRPGETKPPTDLIHTWETLQMINAAVCTGMKTGVISDSLTAIGDEIMRRRGFAQGWTGSYGHELHYYAHHGGIKAGFTPYLPDLDKVLEENMVFTLEPALITSRGRICQEEVVCVSAEGGRMLSTPQDCIWTIP
ncbi:MAG: M24 family metallopeptidase [Symbiobacteriaceae bacterium]|nr:M24 family metallopeptidase [Symbiobacteriaceae bacterium]